MSWTPGPKAPRGWTMLREIDRNKRQTKPVGRMDPANRLPDKEPAFRGGVRTKKRPITLAKTPWDK